MVRASFETRGENKRYIVDSTAHQSLLRVSAHDPSCVSSPSSPPPLTPPTPETPSSPPPPDYGPGPFEIWLVAHVAWQKDPTTSFFFWHRVYCSVVYVFVTLLSLESLWKLPPCYLPNHWKALWVAVLIGLGWQLANGWRARAAEFRRRKEESERMESAG